MEVRSNSRVRFRRESFGGFAYVPHRDDFFALDKNAYELASGISHTWVEAPKSSKNAYSRLAKLGICHTRGPATREISYSGPSFIGNFREIVTSPEPLVLNCFATAFCPLKCVYCHADDLMQDFRHGESEDDLENVAATASLIPSMVAVITGGDPLTRPERAQTLIERLAARKAIVLDTSGVGEIEQILPHLVEHSVHVRVSIDSVSNVNARLRIPNKQFVTGNNPAFEGAQRTIRKCLSAGVSVTVQSVITSRNEDLSELKNLRDWLCSEGISHWVLHLTVKGGSARRIENAADGQQRPNRIVPSQLVFERIRSLIADTQEKKIPIDIRVTDTGSSPNSVLLVGSNGDLFTEGLAHNGKVLLFSASEARPDLIRRYWYHVDAFGHSRRYLNWNPWLYEGESLADLCYAIPEVNTEDCQRAGIVELEAKYKVEDIDFVRRALARNAAVTSEEVLQRDEYFDTPDRTLDSQDFVVRIRKSRSATEIGMKGARFRTPTGEYSRVELEFTAASEQQVRDQIRMQGLERTWFFEKRRTEFRWSDTDASVFLDEIPEIGYFVEIEGSLDEIHMIEQHLTAGLHMKINRNYKELFVESRNARGEGPSQIEGAQFSNANFK